MQYKLLKAGIENKEYGVLRTNDDGTITSFLFDPANTDYQAFKLALTNGAELQDPEGIDMTEDEIKTFLEGLK